MTLRKSVTIFCILVLAVLVNGIVFAKGPPDKVTIGGSNLSDEIEITDSVQLDSFMMGQFVDFEKPLIKPQVVEAGYEITRWYFVGETRLKAIDKFVYYPESEGGRGIIYYEGIIDKLFIYGGSPFDGNWYRPTENGDLVMYQLLTKHDLLPKNTNLFQLALPEYVWVRWGTTGLLVVGGIIFYVIFRRKAADVWHQIIQHLRQSA